MKKFLLILIMLVFVCTNYKLEVSANSNSANFDDELLAKLTQIGFFRQKEVTPEVKITENLNNLSKYTRKKQFKRIKSLYLPQFVTNDGFDFQTYFKMVEDAKDICSEIEYYINIEKIIINGEYALAFCNENTKIKIPNSNIIDKEGIAQTNAYVIYHFKKIGSDWLISSEEIISELTEIKYGDAIGLNFGIFAPNYVKAGENYTISFLSTQVEGLIQIASITNEPIKFPSTKPEEIFKNPQYHKKLERVVKANTQGYNENATVTVGISKTNINNGAKSKYPLSGLAFIVTRVNVNPVIVGEKKINEK